MPVSEAVNRTTITEISTAMVDLPLASYPLYKAGQYVWYFASPVILLLGNFGNVMTIVIMWRMRSAEAVINIYFTALAIMDLFTLNVLLLLDWVGIAFGYHVHYQHDVTCKLLNYTVASTTTSSWILVSLTFHRAASVVWPHRVNSLCTRRLVTGMILGIATFYAVLYSHYLYGYQLEFFSDTGDHRCTMRLGIYMSFVQNIFSYIDLALYCILPFACIFLANIVLVWKLRDSVRQVRRTFAGDESAEAREKATRSVTVTVVTVSAAYIVSTLPVSVYYISMFVSDPSIAVSTSDFAESYLTRAVTFMFQFCNSAVNFYLYCLTGRKFRQEFVKVFSQC